MIFIRRDRTAPRKYTALRVGLFFFAAGLWLAGVRIENTRVTAVAMIIAVCTIFFGLYLRRKAERSDEDESEVADGGW